MARPNLRRVRSTNGSEVHRLAADASDEVGHDSGMRPSLNDDPLEVLVATRANKLQLRAVHANTVRTYSPRVTRRDPFRRSLGTLADKIGGESSANLLILLVGGEGFEPPTPSV